MECPKNEFEDGEIGWLLRYGSWCRALMLGAIKPEPMAHKRFVLLANNYGTEIPAAPALYASYQGYAITYDEMSSIYQSIIKKV